MFKHEELIDALVQAKRLGNALDEVWSCSQQLADAVDRNDQVSVRLVLSMREEPLTKVRQADMALRSQRDSFPDKADREQFSRLLNGEEEGAGEEALLPKGYGFGASVESKSSSRKRCFDIKKSRLSGREDFSLLLGRSPTEARHIPY